MSLPDFTILLARAESDFLEMPGLSVTISQASRLWNAPAEVTAAVLSKLTEHHFLLQRVNGTFVRAWEGSTARIPHAIES